MAPGDVVLVDTNVIIEGHLRGCWGALTGGFRVETVDTCIIEAMTGGHNWNGTKPSQAALTATLHAVHQATNLEMAEVLASGGSGLDLGERALWAHALGRRGAWILCGPDRASMRFGFEQKQRNRLVSLGGLLATIGFRAPVQLRPHFEQKWLDQVMNDLVLGLL